MREGDKEGSEVERKRSEGGKGVSEGSEGGKE